MNTIKEIREKQNQIITMINAAFDEIVTNIEKQNLNINPYESIYESSYPITNVTGFKGRKPIAVIIDDNRIITPPIIKSSVFYKKFNFIFLLFILKFKLY